MNALTRKTSNLRPVQKAAVLMMIFGTGTASAILKSLTPETVQTLGQEMYGLRDIDHATINAVLDEFFERLADETDIGHGTNSYVQTVFREALGEDRAQSVLSRISNSTLDRPIELLDWMDPSAIAELIVDEHPQIMALVIASLDPTRAANVLRVLPDDLQPNIIERIATLNTVQPDALAELERVMNLKFKANTTLRASQIGGVKTAARILNNAKRQMEQRILKDIRKADKDLMEALQDNMFVFENLGRSDDRSLQTLLRAIEPDQLALALKTADDELRDRLLSCLSTRASAAIIDELEALGPVRVATVEEAQKQIIIIAREMADAGTITLAGRGGEAMVS
ncbi:flagellar motor switch protein FliG [Roseovarius sp.]|jgi:flagellar motor switch protein FliG